MTQGNETTSRLDRIEALVLEVATANVHHSNAVIRHDQEFSRINAILESNAALLQDLAAQQRELASQQHEFAAEQHRLAVQQQEAQAEMRASINDVVSMIGSRSNVTGKLSRKCKLKYVDYKLRIDAF
jgi:hypothetical protein